MLSRVILNRVTLSKALLNRHNKNTNSQAKKYTVDDLIQLGYLTAYGNENEGYRIDTAQPLPMPIKDIKDFDAVFIGRSVPASVDTQRACMFNLSNKSHLTESQQKEIISKYNNKPNDRAISQLLFRNYTLPNADLKIIQNKTTDDSWQYSHKMFEGSTFNNVELNIKGSISSTNKLFMGITCNELEIYANSSSGNNMVAGTDIIAPHDTTEMYASSAINKYPRGVSYYRGLSNWTFTNNWNGKATEIPNVRGVETEEERITSSINVMKLPSGILYQTLWITSITRIGPVLDVTNVTGSEYLWGNCGIQLPNVTDIRIKGLNNLDWDFRGGATDKAYIPKMDEDSIIYCLNNVVEQTDTTRNIYFSTEVIKPTYEENSAKLKAALSNASTKGWNVYCGDTALIIPDTPPVGNYIQFEDAEVESVLMANGVSSDGIGITKEDAAAVTSIGTWFKGNTALQSFNELRYFIGVTELTVNAMQNCSALLSANLDNIQYLGGSSLNNTGLDKVYLPSVKTIAGSALSSGKYSVILLGKNLTNIENYAIRINSILHTAICLAETPPTFGSGNFTSVNALTSVYVPDASVETYKTASGWSGVASKFKALSQLATDNPSLYSEIEKYL